MVESAPRNLAVSIASGFPRVLVVSAPAGYGKSRLLRAFAEHIGPLVACDLKIADAADLARPILDALAANDRSRARSAADRLAQRRERAPATSRETLRRAWPLATDPHLFVLRDAGGALATPAGVDLFNELIGALPAVRTLAVSTRAPLPPALQQIVARTMATTVDSADLALSFDAVKELAARADVDEDGARAIHCVAHGWPLVTRLLLGLLRHESAGVVLEAITALPAETLLTFAAHRTIARLDDVVREALIVSVLLHGATHIELVRVLGDDCDDFVFARLAGLPFVELDGARAVVHSIVAGLLRTRFESLVKALYERTLHVLIGEGAYVAAARVALDANDVVRAAAIIDAAPPYTAAPVSLGDYERIIDRIDRELITRFPNVWIATIPYRSFSVDSATFVREAETVYYCLPPAATPDQRAAALMLLASAYANVGRSAESYQLLDDALQGFANPPTAARASILNLAASLRGIEGRFSLARALAGEAAEISRDNFGENQALNYIEGHEAAFRGKSDRLIVVFDELLRRRVREELPLYLAYGAMNGAFFAWAAGDDEAFGRYLAVLEDSLTPALERGFAPMIDAARGRAVQIDDQYPWPVIAAVAHVYQLGEATADDEALRAARAAARAADRRPEPYAQILAHAAIYILDAASRAVEAELLEAIAQPIESPELHDAIRGIIHGGSAGMLESFVRRRVLRKRERAESRFTIELLAGRVTRDGLPIRLSDKEFEVLAVLGSTHGALSRDRIGEALWDHLDPEEWRNNLKVTLSRLRSKLGARDAIIVVDARYRLSPAIDVDLRRAEIMVRDCATGSLDDPARHQLRSILAAFASGDVVRYDRFTWARSLVARINDVVCTAGIALANDAVTRSRIPDALAYASDVAAIDPYNESACEVTIRALLARGDIDAARRQLRQYTTALTEELGASPSERLAKLFRGSA